MEKIVSLAKRKGFVFQGSEIYDGLAGVYDFAEIEIFQVNYMSHIFMGLKKIPVMLITISLGK